MSTISCLVAAMPAEDTAKHVSRLTLKSQLDDMARLWPWVEALIAQFDLPSDTAFAIHLCLEEAISNVIRHGYDGQPGKTLTVDCASPNAHEVVFTIEDQASRRSIPWSLSILKNWLSHRQRIFFGPEAAASFLCGSSPAR